MIVQLNLVQFLDQSSKEVCCISAKRSLQILGWSPVELEVQSYITSLVVQWKLNSWSQLRSSKEVEHQLKWKKPFCHARSRLHISPISEVQLTSLSATSAPPAVEECIDHALTTDRSCSMMKLEVAHADTCRMVKYMLLKLRWSLLSHYINLRSIQLQSRESKAFSNLQKVVKISTIPEVCSWSMWKKFWNEVIWLHLSLE